MARKDDSGPRERPCIGLEAWFERHLWRWHPVKVGHDEALAAFRAEFREHWDREAKNAHADRIYRAHQVCLREWRGLNAADIPTLRDWIEQDLKPPHPEFARICHEIIQLQMTTPITAADCAAMLEPFLSDPEIGRTCRQLRAKFLYDAEHPRVRVLEKPALPAVAEQLEGW